MMTPGLPQWSNKYCDRVGRVMNYGDGLYGGMWLDGFQWNKGHARVSEWRVGEAARTGASVLVVACPYETPRFEDAVKTTGRVEQLAVKDIIELLVDAI